MPADDDIGEKGRVRPILGGRAAHVRDRPVGAPRDGERARLEHLVASVTQITNMQLRTAERVAGRDPLFFERPLPIDRPRPLPRVVRDVPPVARRSGDRAEVADKRGGGLQRKRAAPVREAEERATAKEPSSRRCRRLPGRDAAAARGGSPRGDEMNAQGDPHGKQCRPEQGDAFQWHLLTDSGHRTAAMRTPGIRLCVTSATSRWTPLTRAC